MVAKVDERFSAENESDRWSSSGDVASSFTDGRLFSLSCALPYRVMDLGGKNFRLVQNNLDKDIEPNQSSFLVKKDKIVVKLQKVKARGLAMLTGRF